MFVSTIPKFAGVFCRQLNRTAVSCIELHVVVPQTCYLIGACSVLKGCWRDYGLKGDRFQWIGVKRQRFRCGWRVETFVERCPCF